MTTDTPKRPARAPAKRAAPARAPRPEPEMLSGANRLRRAGRPDTARIQRAPAREEIRIDESARDAAPADRLYRKRKRTDDAFKIDRSIIPQGASYEWKRKATKGLPDSTHQVNLRENGWTPVPASRHPELMPTGYQGAVEKDEMVLMERPSYLTNEARIEDYEIAKDQVRGKEREILGGDTPDGTFTRDHQSVRNATRLNKRLEPMPIMD